MILVSSKGVTETKAKQDQLRDSSEKLGDEVDKNTIKQDKFTTTQTAFRNELPNVASAIYLVQQAYSALHAVVEDLTVAYEEQYTSELKLSTLMTTTSNAVGYTTAQIYAMSEAWSSMTGINDSVLNEAAAIGATFIDISKEVFPDLIEQALNMSAVFGQDLQQSIVQLGVATNNLQVSRLTRIGISFTDQQKDQIAVLRNSGKVLEAQTLIMEELEREIGGVAEAMGESTLGTIRKYANAWVDVKEESGEALTNLKAQVLEYTGLTDLVIKLKDSLAGANASTSIRDLAETGNLSNEFVLANIRLEDLETSLTNFTVKLNAYRKIQDEDEGKLFKQLPAAQVDNLITTYEELVIAVINAVEAKKELEQQNLDAIAQAEVEKKLRLEREALEKLMASYEIYAKLKQKAELSGIDDTYEKQRRELEIEWLEIRKTAWEEHKLTIEELNEKTGNYYEVMLAYINKAEAAHKALLQTERERSLVETFGTEEEQKALEYADAIKQLNETYTEGTAIYAIWKAKIDEAFSPSKEVSEDIPTLFDAFMAGLIGTQTETEILIDLMDTLGSSLNQLGVNLVAGSFEYLGQSMAGLEDGAQSFGQAMGDIIASTMSSVGPSLIAAGAQMLINPATRAQGFALIAAGASMSFSGGYLSQLSSNASSSSSSSSTGSISSSTSSSAIESDITDATSSFTVTDTSATPVTINNYSTASVSASTTTVNGQKTLQVIVDSAVNSGINKGTYNSAMSGQYGMTSTKTQVR